MLDQRALADEDMKIVPDPAAAAPSAEDVAEQAAQEFLRQKELGNIRHARELGARYAQALIDTQRGVLVSDLKGTELPIQHQQYLLYSYVVNRVISEQSPNSIVAQTTLNKFYKDVEEASPELYRHISDMAAFSLYILHERSKARADQEIGFVFADLCGYEANRALADYGNTLFQRLYAFCLQEMQQTPYQEA